MHDNHDLLIRALDEAERLAQAMQSSPTIQTRKGEKDFALDADHAVEQCIRDILSRSQLPILGEENGWNQDSANDDHIFWAVDPIDGTINYARGLPMWGVSIALVKNSVPILAGITFPALQQRYVAQQDQGAFLNGQRLQVSITSSLQQSIVGVGDFSVGPDSFAKNQQRLALHGKLANEVLRIRMPGSAALQLAWVAAGQTDISLVLSNHAWDVQAGVLLVREAGGVVYDRDGSEHTIHSAYTLASNSILKNSVLDLIPEI